MNVIQSIPLMTGIDLVIVALALVALRAVAGLRASSPRSRTTGLVLAALGLLLVAAFFALDLVTMWVLPFWTGDAKANEVMVDLHLNWSWGVLLAASLALAAGIVTGARSLRETERLLDEKDGLYQSIVEGQSELIVRWLPDGTRTFVNDAYCRYRGQARDELVGASFFPFLRVEDRTRVEAKLASLTPERATATDCHPSITPDGDMRWQEWTDRGIFDASGRLVEVQSVGRDITERQKIEDELGLRELKYQALFRASATGLTIRRLEDGKLVDANPAMAEIFGYSLEEFVELRAEDFATAEAVGLYPKMLDAVRQGLRYPFSVKGIHRDGSSLDLEGYFQLLEYDDTQEVLGVVRDVTEQKRTLQALLRSERAQRALFDFAPDAILAHALDGKVVAANPAAGLLFGCPSEGLIGRDVRELVPPNERRRASAMFARLAEGVFHELEQFEALCLAADGSEVPVSIRASRFQLGDSQRVLVHITDITKRRKLEAQLRQSQKMEAVGRLAGGVAHDFNNLLTAILGYSELAQAEIGPDHTASEDLAEIERAAERAANLTHQLLAFSRQQVLQPEVVDLNSIVLNIEKLCRRTLGEDVRLMLKLDPELGRVRVDKGQMEQVLLNLAINARDAMPSGGELRLETENIDIDEKYETRDAPVPFGSYVVMTVSDTGSGMTEEVRSQVFEPFFSTKPADKGTGLGLSTVYGIVKQSGGYIWVRSEAGVGSSFEILLPLVEGALRVHEAQEKLANKLAGGRGSRTVLVVDDNPIVLRLAKRVLEDHEYSVLAASTGEEAFALADDHRGAIDLLLTDLVLPGIDGLRLARDFKLRFPELSIILMTGYSRQPDIGKTVGLEELHFLQKPFVRRSLLKVVEAALPSATAKGRVEPRFEVEPHALGDLST